MTNECNSSYGTILFDHLAANRAGLTASQVTVVAVGQVYAIIALPAKKK